MSIFRLEKTKGVATALKRLHVDRKRFRSEIWSFWKIWCNSSGGRDKTIVCVGREGDRRRQVAVIYVATDPQSVPWNKEPLDALQFAYVSVQAAEIRFGKPGMIDIIMKASDGSCRDSMYLVVSWSTTRLGHCLCGLMDVTIYSCTKSEEGREAATITDIGCVNLKGGSESRRCCHYKLDEFAVS